LPSEPVLWVLELFVGLLGLTVFPKLQTWRFAVLGRSLGFWAFCGCFGCHSIATAFRAWDCCCGIFGFIELFVGVSGFVSIGEYFSFGFSELWCGYFGFDNIGKASD
jgi:hypothetical protein